MLGKKQSLQGRQLHKWRIQHLHLHPHIHTSPPPHAPKLISSQLWVKLIFVYICVCINSINTIFFLLIIGSQQIKSKSENSRNNSVSILFRNRESKSRENRLKKKKSKVIALGTRNQGWGRMEKGTTSTQVLQ